MRFKTGVVVGFAAGYYFGAKAGRERYHQLQDLLDRVRDSNPAQQLLGQAKAAVVETRERALDAIETHTAAATPTPTSGSSDVDPTDRHPLFRNPTLN